jgi:hypothetical protein
MTWRFTGLFPAVTFISTDATLRISLLLTRLFWLGSFLLRGRHGVGAVSLSGF